MPPDRRWKTAVHEAGHAVVGIHYGVPIIRVGIGDDGAGFTDFNDCNYPATDCLSVMGLAGDAAVAEFFGLIEDDADDRDKCFAMLAVHYQQPSAMMAVLERRAASLVRRQRRNIDAIANALTARGILTGAEVRAIALGEGRI
jgi:hypothetical protein